MIIKKKISKTKIDYLNVYQKGSVLHVEYTPASHNQKTVLKYQDYIAKKDGIIRQLDVKQGNVLVKVNQYVKKGDVLISHQIEDTKQQIKMIPTLGKCRSLYLSIYRGLHHQMLKIKIYLRICFLK